MPAPTAFQTLKTIASQNRRRLIGTFSLVAAENLLINTYLKNQSLFTPLKPTPPRIDARQRFGSILAALKLAL
ncbi:hypothetical protein A7P95_06315 [Eikenella longinqua]|uniref:Uncharacterized protein n=1 Tax=Eikenella longinqua TaxID=1795827 RepID=A0A1A9RVS2_9NEIS|nr:hypothetical protein [Eikenella longinqua]OAM27727.1 hypothetical protein A7P95_06315 [Eikenella longinqua]